MAASHTLCTLIVLFLYSFISLKVFDKVQKTSHTVIDELYHIPQGIHYCHYNFTHWDSKITTLPGLYIVSTLMSILFQECSLYVLRFTNLAAACLNFYLLVVIVEKQNNFENLRNLKCIFQALNLAMLPPLYFFSHIYYTDTLSLTFILLFINFTLSKSYIFAMISGAFSVVMRQTNIVWVTFYLGRKVLDSLYRSYIKSLKGKDFSSKTQNTHTKDVSTKIYTLSDVFSTLLFHSKTLFVNFFKHITLNDLLAICSNAMILLGFAIFVYINGSIVVGDKTAHVAAVHIPQLFYFTLFYAIFTVPLLLSTLHIDIENILTGKYLKISLCILCVIVVHLNTIVHPYLLADNRHYTFYVWHRFYGRYQLAKYIVIPLYVYIFYSIMNQVRSYGAGFSLPYMLCLFVSLALQQMLEVRYFLIPYIILRVSYKLPSWKVIVLEFLIYFLINSFAFYIFFTKEIQWNNFNFVQRLIW